MSRYVALPKAVALAVPMARPKPAFKASAPACKVTTGDYLELIARQTSGSTKNVDADGLTYFGIEVVD
jgi:hypothetical protein